VQTKKLPFLSKCTSYKSREEINEQTKANNCKQKKGNDKQMKGNFRNREN
jgi:hypothetical protein